MRKPLPARTSSSSPRDHRRIPMTNSQPPSDLIESYNQGWLDFKMLVNALIDAGMKPRDAYAAARKAEEAYMRSIAKRAWDKMESAEQ
jgi:hypothetical protein